MTNYEKIRTLSINQLARLNVKGYLYSCGYRPQMDFITSDGNILSDKEEAIEYEINWLNNELDKETFCE